MGIIMLKLAGPLQSWGDSSRFTTRATRQEPTKSGIVGMAAAALGRKRTEKIDDLAALMFAVRIDQPGGFLRDFQTAHKWKWSSEDVMHRNLPQVGTSMPLSQRYYLTDAVFVAALRAEGQLFNDLVDAFEHPRYALYLGRRSCPPACKVLLSTFESNDMMQAMAEIPWQASSTYQRNWRRKHPLDNTVRLGVFRDALPDDDSSLLRETVRDVPLSFSQVKRDYSWRTVIHDSVALMPSLPPRAIHDPWAALEEV